VCLDPLRPRIVDEESPEVTVGAVQLLWARPAVGSQQGDKELCISNDVGGMTAVGPNQCGKLRTADGLLAKKRGLGNNLEPRRRTNCSPCGTPHQGIRRVHTAAVGENRQQGPRRRPRPRTLGGLGSTGQHRIQRDDA
jgi:hypothetical protein